MGLAMMGTGMAEGPDRAMEAARKAISSPLLEGTSVNGSRGVIINVTGGPDLSLVEVSEASLIVQEAADEDANIIFGAVVDPTLKGKVKITVIATGFGHHSAARPVGAPAVTPVDLSSYVEPRLRADAAAAAAATADRTLASRLQTVSTGRRATIDLPLAASSAGPTSALAMTLGKADGGNHGVPAQNAVDSDFDLNSRFDVPAFLRRQEN
jgi:hypothetical protein